MNAFVYHAASGQAFFSGAGLIVVACLLSMRREHLARRMSPLLFVLGVIAVVISSTPVPYWYCAVLLVASVCWLLSGFYEKWRQRSAVVLALLWCIAIGREVPYHVTPIPNPTNARTLTVIGDSVTAGLGDRKTRTWTALLSEEHGIDVQDLSFPGATTKGALSKVKASDLESQLVLLEIGGNDLLGTTTVDKYARNLEALLADLHTQGRQIVMLELPLPPLSQSFGRAQRSLANKYDVILIPKRLLLDILAEDENTLDAIHLSQVGHQRMAESVWRLLEPAYGDAVQ